MHHTSQRLGIPKICSLLVGCVLIATQPILCEPPATTNPPTQAAHNDQSATNSDGTRQPSPHSQGAEFPVPPQQGQPWMPPAAALPHEVVDAIRAVYEEGLADPRGCDYREIKVAMGTRGQGDAGVVTTHGWVLPGNEGFAVCWNGLIYPVLSAGAAADLRADVLASLQADQEALKKEEAEWRAANPQGREPIPGLPADSLPDDKRFDPYSLGNVPERVAVSYQTMLPFKAVLLLRLGEGELAARLWSQWFDPMDSSRPKNPFLWLNSVWAWANFNRATFAHLGGDDRLALASTRVLTAIQTAYGDEEARRRFEMRYGLESRLGFLGQLSALLADSERRLAEAPYTPVLASPPPHGGERIAGLIHDLELVSDGYWRPCGSNTPVVEALIQEGEPAVESLLRCVEADTRLTRAVRFYRDFDGWRTFPGVQEPAFTALQGILRTNSFGRDDMESINDLIEHGLTGRKAVADEIRAWRDKYSKLSVAQRQYETLRDPQSKQWTEAMDWIVQPASVSQSFAGKFSGSSDMDRPADGAPRFFLQGESLRSLTNPSVSELLVQRLHTAEQALDVKAGDSAVSANVASADKIARALATWDGVKQLDALRDFSQRLRALFDQAVTWRVGLVPALAATYKDRAALGDPAALDEYVAWLITVPPDGLEPDAAASLLRPAWMHPESPPVQQVVAELFAEAGKWSPVLKPDRDVFHSFNSLLATPLVGMAGFRAELLRGLQDKRPGGEVKIAKNQVSLEAGGSGSYWSVDHALPLVPPDGSMVPFRICDFYGYHLSGLPGAPRCELYWPEANRDEAIRQIITYLETYGDNLQRGPDQSDSGTDMMMPGNPDGWFLGWPHDADHVRLGFPSLDHPATAEDVRAHRAVFALEGERRLYKLPEQPMRVIWTTLQDNPLHGTSTDADGKTVTSTRYDQWAGAWQAEEMLKDGRWERFLGVVSAHRIARVPAAEIEFYLPDEWYMPPDKWSRLDHGFAGVLTVPHTQGEWLPSGHFYDPMPPGQPVQATLQVRNQLAQDQTLPADVFQTIQGSKTLPPEVKLTLFYSAKTAPASNARTPPPRTEELQPWAEVPCQVETAAASKDGNLVPMVTLEAKTVFQIDLRDFFDLSRPGSYRLRADIQRPDVLAGQPAEATFTIIAAP